jgi:hypothetical protein
MKKLFLTMLFCLILANSYANEQKNITYEPTNTSVSWELLPDGSDWERIFSTGEADLKFGDTRDVRLAKKKAVLRAKAELSKFFKETISTEETIEDITKESLNATAGNQGISEENTRKTVVTTIERTKNQSDAILKGVIVLETKVDRNDKVVVVKVGLSRNSIDVASRVQSTIKNSDKNNISQVPSKNESGVTIKRSPMYDNF